MRKKAPEKLFAFFLLAGFAGLSMAFPQNPPIHKLEDQSKTLQNRRQQGFQVAQAENMRDSYWMGYSITKVMPEDIYYFSWNGMVGRGHWRRSPTNASLEDLLSGRFNPIDTEQKLKAYTQEVLNRMGRKDFPEVEKSVAVLFKQKPGTNEPEGICLCSLDFPFELENHPLIWLGKAGNQESLELLWEIYQNFSGISIREEAVRAIGMHDAAGTVIPLLESVLNEAEALELREAAASELGNHNHSRAVELLLHIAMQDPSLEVREEAASALEDIALSESVDALIKIARRASDQSVREEAVQALGDKAAEKAGKELNQLANEETETVRLQKIALEALEDLDDNQGLPYLIQIALKHKNPAVRKYAIQALGDFQDPRALETLIEILKR